MNHRNAMPASGISTAATLRFVLAPSSHGEPDPDSSGIDVRISSMAAPNRTANSTPARPAARGVDNRRARRGRFAVIYRLLGLAGQQANHQSVGLGEQIVVAVMQFGVDEGLAVLGLPDPA